MGSLANIELFTSLLERHGEPFNLAYAHLGTSAPYLASWGLFALSSSSEGFSLCADAPNGTAVCAIILSNALGLYILAQLQSRASNVYAYVIENSGFTIFIAWAVILGIHGLFRRTRKARGDCLEDLPSWGSLYPYETADVVAIYTITMISTGYANFTG